MRKIFCIIMSLILSVKSYYAMESDCCPLLPKMVLGSDAYSRFICSEEKAEYFNNLMKRLWNKDFGKFLRAFCIFCNSNLLGLTIPLFLKKQIPFPDNYYNYYSLLRKINVLHIYCQVIYGNYVGK